LKASDYIAEYLIAKGVSDVFGYPGGMVTHLMDSFGKYRDKITAHLCYNEQGAAMAACGFALAGGGIGVAYATSGPGATNLITGICNAYMDSIPTVFITGQVNSYEQKGDLNVRQRGFQETDIVSIVKPITKYAVSVNSVDELRESLDRAFYEADHGRKGPALLDIAMNVTRLDIDPATARGFEGGSEQAQNISDSDIRRISDAIAHSVRPVLLVGNGLPRTDGEVFSLLNSIPLPVVSSMPAVDVRAGAERYYGFIGAYGDRTANFVVAKSDLLISIGARLDVRQVGARRENFAPDSLIVRVDNDPGELEYKAHDGEIGVRADSMCALRQIAELYKYTDKDYSEWFAVCDEISEELKGTDDREPNIMMREIGKYIPEGSVITTDVGQNQVWAAQSLEIKNGQRLLFSAGHGAMGFSLPAAIGASYCTDLPVWSLNGDGGIQMNIQEMQWISRERLPVRIVIFNNHALGMIRHFQEMYFDSYYFQTVEQNGYACPDFEKLAAAYRMDYRRIDDVQNVRQALTGLADAPTLIEVCLSGDTYVFPKLEFGKPNQDQEPLLDRELYNKLQSL